jgi:hypothetical protein
MGRRNLIERRLERYLEDPSRSGETERGGEMAGDASQDEGR